MAVRITARYLAPLVAVVAVGLALPAMADTPAPVATTISDVSGVLTAAVPPSVGVNNHLSATLNGPAGVVKGKTLTFTTVATAATAVTPGTPATFLCTATTDANGVGTCNALVGVDPKAIQGAGVSQIAAKGAFTVAFAGDATLGASNGSASATFYGTPGLPVHSARR